MKQDQRDGDEDLALPVWARNEAFPEAEESFGWVDRKGRRHIVASQEELAKTIREDKGSDVSLVWTPDSSRCRVPEEVEVFSEPIREVRKIWIEDDLSDARSRLKRFGIALALLLGYMVFQASSALSGLEGTSEVEVGFPEKVLWMIKALTASTTVGMSLLAFLVFAFIPWYQAQKKAREFAKSANRPADSIPLIRFEIWLDFQKAPVTWFIMAVISLTFIAQVWFEKSILVFRGTVTAAGLEKEAYRAGEYWRLITAPMLHGGIVHFVMNALALLYLGKRVEVFARWPHVPIVFLFSAMVGGEASARFLDAPSVGASGGLMGWLGFLLVFETLHSKLVPSSARRRLLGGVVMTGLIGLVGYRFIDNAAHLGGLLAGMAYAAIVFPKSGSVIRPKMNLTDRLIGVGSMTVIVAGALLAIIKLAS